MRLKEVWVRFGVSQVSQVFGILRGIFGTGVKFLGGLQRDLRSCHFHISCGIFKNSKYFVLRVSE